MGVAYQSKWPHKWPLLTQDRTVESGHVHWVIQNSYPGILVGLDKFDGWNSDDMGSVSHAHDDVIKWKHFPRYWPFVWGIHRSPVNSPHKGQWRGALMFSLVCARINDWVNNCEAGDLRCYGTNYVIVVMKLQSFFFALFGWVSMFRSKELQSTRIYHI